MKERNYIGPEGVLVYRTNIDLWWVKKDGQIAQDSSIRSTGLR